LYSEATLAIYLLPAYEAYTVKLDLSVGMNYLQKRSDYFKKHDLTGNNAFKKGQTTDQDCRLDKSFTPAARG